MRAAALAVVLAACNTAVAPAPTKEPPAKEPAAEAKPVRQFGAAFTLPAAEPLAQAVARCGAPDGKPAESCGALNGDEPGKLVRVKGSVTAVCQKMGCWMMLQDGNVTARIFTRDHQFFLPQDIVGKTAEVEGTLRAKAISPEFAKHLAEDSGKSAAPGASQEYVMSATGVTIAD